MIPDITPLNDDQALTAFFHLIGGFKGASAMGLALVSVQIAYVALRSRLGEKTGLYRMVALSALAAILSVLGQLAVGQSLFASLTNSTAIAAFQSLFAQFVIQFNNRHEDKVLTVTPDKLQ